jgi:2',3'-cyclic-nucleotide 2'-phosphodiesterase (5'-nucleotidase family)
MRRIIFYLLIFNCYLFAQTTVRFPTSEYQKVVVIFTNDVHGGIDQSEATFINPDFPPKLGGGAIAGRYILQQRELARKNGWGFLLIDAGDIYQGTPLGTLTEGAAIIEYMNTVQYDAMALGNHDFDNGWQNLKRLAEQAQFPFLAANLYRQSTGELAEFVKPYIIKEFGGVKIGLIGIALSTTPSMSFPDNIADLDFRSEVEALRQYVPEIRAQGVNTIIAVTHTWLAYDPKAAYLEMLDKIKNNPDALGKGGNALEIAYLVPGIDIMYTGHLHRGFYKPWEEPINHTLIFQNYANGSNLGHVNFYLHRQTGKLAGYDYASDQGALFTLFQDDFLPDPAIAQKIDELVRQSEAGFDEIIGSARGNFKRAAQGESALGNLIVDAMREAVQTDLAMANLGTLRGELRAGSITPREIFKIMPFGNRIVIMQVSGQLIKDLIEDRVSGNSRGMLISGGRVVINRQLPDGQRVVKLTINGAPIDLQRQYRLAVSDYLAEGNSGFSRLTTVPVDNSNYTGILVRQAIIDYVRRHSPLTPQTDGRWQESK